MPFEIFTKIVEGTPLSASSLIKKKSDRRVSFIRLWNLMFHQPKGIQLPLSEESVEHEPSTVNSPETAFIRFLLHGQEKGQVANISDLTKLSEDNLISFRRLLSQQNIPKIERAIFLLNMTGVMKLSPLQRSIPFLLAELAKRTSFSSINDLARDVLKDPEEFLLFVMFFVETDPFIPDEQFQKFLDDWYCRQEIPSLLEMVCEEPHHHGFAHTDAMKFGNFESATLSVNIIHEYARNGLEAASLQFGNEPLAADILDFLRTIEAMRQTKNPDLATSQIIFGGQSLSTTNAAALKDKKVMRVLLKRMSLRQLMLLLKFMNEEGFFMNGEEVDGLFIRRIEERLSNYESIESSNILPSESVVVQGDLKNLNPSIPLEIINALDKQIEKAFMNVTRIDIDITIVINCHRLHESSCVRRNLSAIKAASVLALTLKRAARHVKILTFQNLRRQELNETCVTSLTSAIKARANIDSSDSIKDFAGKHSGVLVAIGHSFNITDFCGIAKEKSVKSKSVLCNLCDVYPKNPVDHEDILVTVGFNENTCDIISAFLVLNQIL